MNTLNLQHFIPIYNTFNVNFISSEVRGKVMEEYVNNWKNDLMRENSKRGDGGNKLRFYRTFKRTFNPEKYITESVPRSHRRALGRFRCGTAPLHVETGRYNNTLLDERTCFHCPGNIEDESHVLLHCPLYCDYRSVLFNHCCLAYENFTVLNNVEKMCFIMSCPDVVFTTAKTCKLILQRRTFLLYNK